MLLVYVAISFGVWNSFEVQPDNPTITDPAASYVLGQGFTSGTWYIQEHDEFWASCVPLQQLLLIPWFKVFGFGCGSVQAIALLYIAVAMVLVWLGVLRSGLIASAGWRLGLVAFFLASDCSLGLAIAGRHEPLCLLIACAAGFALTLHSRWARWGGLAACGMLAPWAGLQLASYFAVTGIGMVFVFQRRYLREVLALAGGGILGSLALLLFYKQMGVWDKFLINISPHTGITAIHTVTTGVEDVRNWGHRLGGLKNVNVLWAIFLSAWVCWANFSDKRAWRIIAFSVGCIIGIPAFLAGIGVFQAYYGCFLLLPLSVCLFTLLSRNARENVLRTRIMVCLLLLSAVMPGSYLWRLAVQGVPSLLSGNNQRIVAFVKNSIHPDDVAFVDRRLWYAAKPLAKETLALFWETHARTSKDRDKVSVVVTLSDSQLLELLPGKWQPTGEFLEVPDFHRFYRISQKEPPQRFTVYRRVDRP